jgi:phosphohistidine phosphatase
MSKKLILIRHAKSDWSVAGQADFERGLNQRGQTDLPIMKSKIHERQWNLDIVLCSSAERTRLTYAGLSESKVVFLDELYHAQSLTILKLLSQYSEDNIAIIGHNPGVTQFVNDFCNEQIENVPTLGICCIEYKKAKMGKGKLKEFIYPKMFK